MLSLPSDDVKKQETLSQVAKKFKKGNEYSEEEVNQIIKSFDVDDHILIRRELVNFNYLGKDSYKGIYWLKASVLSDEELARIGHNQNKLKKSNVY